MRQHDRDHRRPVEAEDSIWTALPVALIVVLMIGVATMGALRTFHFGPTVGDVIVFQPGRMTLSPDGVQRSDVTVAKAESGSGTCVLNPATMAADGGSLVVERSVTSGQPLFQVHWAGRRTSTGPADCGSSANLLLPPADLLDLAGSAGGFGVGHKVVGSVTKLTAMPTMID